MGVTAVQLFSLPESDQDRARDFSVDVPGFELVNDDPMAPDAVGADPTARAATSIALVTWFDTTAPGSTKGTVLEPDDLDGEIVGLRERGVVIE